MDYLITQYPVTHNYLDRLAQRTGAAVEPIIVSTISARGYWRLFRYFRGIDADTIYLPVLDPAGWPLLAPMQVLAMLPRADRRVVVGPDFEITEIGIGSAALALARMTAGGLHGLYTVLRESWRLFRLLRLPRVRVGRRAAGRVLYLKTNLWLGIQAGGSVSHTAGVILGLLNKGLSVDFAAVESPVALPKRDNLSILQVEPHAAYVIPREFNHYRHNRRFVDDVTRKHGEFEGVIYQRLSLGNVAGVELSRRYGQPLVLEYNGSENWLASNWGTPLLLKRLALMAETVMLRHAHMVVTVSDVLRDELIARGVDPERIVAYPNGVDTDQFDPERFPARKVKALRKRLGIPDGALVVTFVGTFGPWHGAEVFARAIADMAANHMKALKAHDLRFLFIGDGVRRQQVEQIVSKSAGADRTVITGLVDQDDTALYLAASDILVSPHVPNPDGSAFFGSPTKLFEYLASGRPVVGSDLYQIGEVLADCPRVDELASGAPQPKAGASGIRVQPEDAAGIVTAIRYLAENPAWRLAAGKTARTHALTRYKWDHHVAEILAGLERVRALEQSRPVRVLFNGLHSKSGGGLTYLNNVVPHMAGDPEIDLHLCVHEDQKGDLPRALNRVTVHTLDFTQGFWRLQFHEQTAVPRLAREIGADVTFSPANYGPVTAPNSVLLLRNALSVAFVERRPLKLAYWILLYIGTLASMFTAKRIITVSEYARRAAGGGVMGSFADRVTVIPHGVSSQFTPPGRNQRRDNYLLAVSDIYVQKNLTTLIDAFSRVVRDHPEVSLKIAGRPVDQDYFDRLKQAVEGAGLAGRVEFLGGVSPARLVDLYRRCRVFVFPSTVETFGNPLVEAMACGAPIASSNSAAMPEILGDAALFFDPSNAEDMARAIGSLLKDVKLRTALSKRARERAKNFSWERTTERTLEIVKNAAQG